MKGKSEGEKEGELLQGITHQQSNPLLSSIISN